MAFDWDIKHFPTVAHFEAYLLTVPPPEWCHGITVHHTYNPTVADWRGEKTMKGMARYYQGLGWDAGPHVYPAPDGIWQGTPVSHIGVHAGICNSRRIGVEVVGDYDPAPWAEPVKSFALGTIIALIRWNRQRLSALDINGHRDCKSSKSCPGKAVSIPWIIRQVQSALAFRDYLLPLHEITGQKYRVIADGSNIRSKPGRSYPVLRVVNEGFPIVAAREVEGEPVGGNAAWVEIADGGFIHSSLVEPA